LQWHYLFFIELALYLRSNSAISFLLLLSHAFATGCKRCVLFDLPRVRHASTNCDDTTSFPAADSKGALKGESKH